MLESDAITCDLQSATDRLRDLLREVISESPRVRSELKNLHENGHHVLMGVDISLAFQKDAGQDIQAKRAYAAAATKSPASGDAANQSSLLIKVETTHSEGRTS